MKTRTIHEAFDGKTFDSAEACKAHEAAHVETRLVGLTLEQVRAAIAREDVELADAFEEIGNRIAKTRRESGELRRGRKAAAEQDASVIVLDAPALPAAPAPPADPMQEALRRAKAPGRAAWDRKEGGVVPDTFSGAKPLHDAWLDGWEEGQADAALLKAAGQSRALADAEG